MLIGLFAVFAIILLTLGLFYGREQENRMTHEKEDELTATATLKVGQIERWRSERIGDGVVIRANRSVARVAAQLFKGGAHSAGRQEIIDWMRELRAYYEYESIYFLDTKGTIRLEIGAQDGRIGPVVERSLAEIRRTRQVVLTDLHMSTDSVRPHMDLIAPLLMPGSGDTDLVGFVLLTINPATSLFPIIESWPTPSASIMAGGMPVPFRCSGALP